jgi:transposase
MSEAKVHVSVEQRFIIKFLTKEGCKLSEICSRLKRQYGKKTLSNVSVYKWSSAFKKEGENSDRVDALIQENRRITLHELSGIRNISDGSVKTIIKQHLQYSKVCAQWIPCLLMGEHKSTRFQVAQLLL